MYLVSRINLGALLNFFLFISFCLGIIFGHFFPYFLLSFILSLISFSLTCLCYRKNRLFLSDIFILLFFFFLGALWQIPQFYQKVDKFLNNKNRVTLRVVSLPQDKDISNTFTGEIEKINNLSLKQRVKVRDYSKSLEYLNIYKLSGKLTRKKYQGRWFYYLSVKSDTEIKKLPLRFWDKFVQKSAIYILNVFKTNCTQQGYRFLSAVFLGQRELLGEEKDFFTKTGVSHLLAISGLHLGLTSLILFFVLRFFNLSFRTRLLVSLIFLYFYTFLTGASPSTLRAAIMYSVFAFSFFIKRKVNTLNSLALAGFIILLFEPSALFNIGFQLSFISVLAIILGFKIFDPKPATNLLLTYSKQIFFCSFFVTLFITPLVSYYFGKIYILSIFYNVILIPFFTFILTVNFLLIAFSPFAFIAQSLGSALSLLISLFIGFIRILGSFSFSFISYTFSPRVILIYYFFLIIFFLSFHKVKNVHFRKSHL